MVDFAYSALIEYSAVNVLYRRRTNRIKRYEREIAGTNQMQRVVCSSDGRTTSVSAQEVGFQRNSDLTLEVTCVEDNIINVLFRLPWEPLVLK